MMRLVFLALFSVSAVKYSFSQSVLRPCDKMCVKGKVCRQVYNVDTGAVQAQCVRPPPVFTPKGVCTVGEPLLQVTPSGVNYAFCGRGPSRIVCPAGYHCVIDPVDRYAVCCADVTSALPKSTTAAPVVKPGTCPRPSTLRCGPSRCSSDRDCPDDRKCCANACGRSQCSVPAPPSCNNFPCPTGEQCQMQVVPCFVAPCPVLPTCVPIDVQRPGTCPAPSGLIGTCQFIPGVNCLQDSDCAVGQKCCSEGCGKVCKPVVT